MAIGTDRVQLHKTESTALGGKDSDAGVYDGPVPISAQEDAIESAGGYVQDESNRDENVGWHRDLGELKFFDEAAGNAYPGHTLTQLLAAGFTPTVILISQTIIVPETYQYIVYQALTIDGTLVLDGQLVTFE